MVGWVWGGVFVTRRETDVPECLLSVFLGENCDVVVVLGNKLKYFLSMLLPAGYSGYTFAGGVVLDVVLQKGLNASSVLMVVVDVVTVSGRRYAE